MTAPEPLDPAVLAEVRSRDKAWGEWLALERPRGLSDAVIDRRALLAEVDRLAEALAAAELRVTRLADRQAETQIDRDSARDEADELRARVQQVKAELSPLRVVYAALPDLPATRRLRRTLARLAAALAGETEVSE